jgi:hypothetical protein
MSLRTRNIIAIFFVSAFVILTTAISLYASGYKFNLHWPINSHSLLQKTGMLITSTEPNGAIIYINNKPKKNTFRKIWNLSEKYLKTPSKIKNLLPGYYDLKLEKDGYWTWNDEIEIRPGQATLIENIVLFKKSLPWQISSGQPQSTLVSPDKKFVILTDDKKVIDLKNDQEIILPDKDQINSLKWLDTNRLSTNLYIMDASTPENIDYYENIIGKDINNLKCSSSNSKIYYQYQNSINCFDLNKKINENIFSEEDIIDYQIQSNRLIAILKDKIIVYSLTKKAITAEIKVPSSEAYEFWTSGNDLINIYNRDHSSLYLIDPDNKTPIRELIVDIKQGNWIDNNRLLYTNGHEINIYHFQEDRLDLIIRSGDLIEDLVWHPSNHIIYSTANKINLFDFSQSQNSTNTLLELEEIKSLFLNNKGDILYFSAKIGNQSGFYKMLIQ